MTKRPLLGILVLVTGVFFPGACDQNLCVGIFHVHLS
jgi:hypothetical protein